MSGSTARTIAIRLSTQDAELVRRQLEKLGADGKRALEQIDTASAKAQPAMRGLATASDTAVRGFQALGVSMGGASSGFVTAAGRAGNVAAALAAIGVGAAAAGTAIARAGDQATEALARLQAATGSLGAAQQVYEGLFALSQQTGVAVSESASAFSRFAVAARQIGATNNEVLALVRTVQQAGIVAGTGAQETSAAVMQLGQALASGRLQGDELRSIMENMPTLAEALARELGVSVGEMRKLGTEGKLTADVVMPALIRAGQNINAEFEKMPVTMGRSFAILGESMARFAADLDRALGLSQGIARAAQAAAAAVNQGRVAVGLGTPMEQAAAGYERGQSRVSTLDARLREFDAAIEAARANLIPSGLSGTRLELAQRVADQDPAIAALRRQRTAAAGERETAMRELQQFIEQRNRLEREAQEAGDAESVTATQRQIASQRQAAQQRLSDLQDALEKDRKVRAEHADRVREIEDQARRGAIDPAEAARLRALADRARDEALSKLEETQSRANETDREAQRLIERGISLAQQSASEQEKFADQVRALEAAQAAGRITQEQYNRAIGELDPEARRARDAMEKARQEAEKFAERSREALAGLGENALDRIGSGIVNAFAIGGRAVINWGNIARQVIASVVTDMAKLAIVNPLVNAAFGAARPTLFGAIGAAGGGVGAAGQASPGLFSGATNFSGLAGFANLSSLPGIGSLGGIGSGISSFLNMPLFGSAAQASATNAALAAMPPGMLGPATPASVGLPGMSVGGFLGAAGLGAGLGMAGGSITGALRGTANPLPGTLIGTGLGFVLGGPIGAGIGGALGGLFGPTVRGNASRAGGDVFLGVDANGQLIITSARGKRWDQAGATAEVQSQLDAINAQIGARGLTFAGPGQAAVGFGQASGSPRELSLAALVGQLRSGNANQMTAFGTLAGRGGDLEQALQAADFVTQVFEPLLEAEKKTGTFTAAMEALTKTYDEAIKKAKELGLSETGLQAQRAERAAKLEADRARDVDIIDRTLGARRATLAGDTRGAALTQFDLRAEAEDRAFREQLRNLGFDEAGQDFARRMVELEQIVADERLAVMREFDSQMRGISQGLLEQLTLGDLGGLAPEARFGAGLSLLNNAQAALADGATVQELAEFSRVAQNVLPIAKEFLGISSNYAELVADVSRTLRTAAPGSDPANLGAILEASLNGSDRVEMAILSTGQSQTTVLQTLLTELKRLTAQNEALLARAAA